jgi:hypothetical protein
LNLWQLNQIYRLWDGAQLRGTRQREEPHCCDISDLLNFLPQLAAFVALEAFAHLSFCIILDGLMRLELRFAALAMAECDGCKFHYLENSFRHIISPYYSAVPLENSFGVRIDSGSPYSIVALVDGGFQSLCVVGEVFEHRKLSMGRAFDVLLGFVAFAQKLNLLPAILFAARDPSRGLIHASLHKGCHLDAQIG